jgi:sigma-E factor negative regulatory protein RseA
MTQDISMTRELVSALADGQLRGEEFAHALALIEHDDDARAHWHAYHLVGDVLRSAELAASSGRDAAFVAGLRQRLQQEKPAFEASDAIEMIAFGAYTAKDAGQNYAENMSANDASMRWKLVAGFASLAAVMVVGWHLAASYGTADGAPQLAQAGAPAPQVTAEATPIMIRDPRLDQLLAAHQQFGGTSALQMPAGFLRNATFERPAR